MYNSCNYSTLIIVKMKLQFSNVGWYAEANVYFFLIFLWQSLSFLWLDIQNIPTDFAGVQKEILTKVQMNVDSLTNGWTYRQILQLVSWRHRPKSNWMLSLFKHYDITNDQTYPVFCPGWVVCEVSDKDCCIARARSSSSDWKCKQWTHN